MTSPATLGTINLPQSNRSISPILCSSSSHYSLRITNTKQSNPNLPRLRSIKTSASDSTAIIDTPTAESKVRIGARVRVTVTLTVYHVPKVAEVDLKGKEGTLKEDVTVWKGKHISANFPYKIEFLEILEGRGDKPVKFFAHLRDDEFEYID